MSRRRPKANLNPTGNDVYRQLEDEFHCSQISFENEKRPKKKRQMKEKDLNDLDFVASAMTRVDAVTETSIKNRGPCKEASNALLDLDWNLDLSGEIDLEHCFTITSTAHCTLDKSTNVCHIKRHLHKPSSSIIPYVIENEKIFVHLQD